MRIDQLSRDFKVGADTHHWAEMIEQVNSGEMPPKKEKQPSQAEIAAFVSSLDARIKEGKSARMAARPSVAHYRLSRKEYQNTVYDLLGVRYDPAKPGELNEDTLWHGFERIGSELSLSPSHVDRYFRAAELVLDRAFSTAASSEARKVRKTAAELRYGGGKDQQAALDRVGEQTVPSVVAVAGIQHLVVEPPLRPRSMPLPTDSASRLAPAYRSASRSKDSRAMPQTASASSTAVWISDSSRTMARPRSVMTCSGSPSPASTPSTMAFWEKCRKMRSRSDLARACAASMSSSAAS